MEMLDEIFTKMKIYSLVFKLVDNILNDEK